MYELESSKSCFQLNRNGSLEEKPPYFMTTYSLYKHNSEQVVNSSESAQKLDTSEIRTPFSCVVVKHSHH